MGKHFFMIALAMLLLSCKGKDSSAELKPSVQIGEKDVVEVLTFHTKKRCSSCLSVEKYAREVVESYGSENVKIKVIDISDKANSAIAKKYKVAWASLFVTYNGKSENLTKMAFLQGRLSTDKFKSNLKNSIENIKK